MTPLAKRLTHLAQQLETLHETIPVDQKTVGLTIEQHSPGNGSTYTRLRAQKGKTLPNGNRTMSLDEQEVEEWQQKLYARNQQTKVAQCLLLVQQAADVASSITWDARKAVPLVSKSKKPTKKQAQPKRTKSKSTAKAKPPKLTIKYVLKDAANANTNNRKVHAIAQAEPKSGRWYTPALCGEQPKAGSWGWRTCDPSDFSCPKCYDKLQLLT